MPGKQYISFMAILLCSLMPNFSIHAQTPLEKAAEKAQAGQAAKNETRALVSKREHEAAQKKYTESQKLFDEVVFLCQSIQPEKIPTPKEAELYGSTMATAGQFDLAAQGYERAFQLDSSSSNLAILAAHNWSKVGGKYVERAIPLLRRVIALEHNEAGLQSVAHSELGLIYQTQGLYTLSGEAYRKALELDSTNTDAILGHVVTKIQQGKLNEANTILSTITDLTQEQGIFLQKGVSQALVVMESNHVKLAETAQIHYAYAMFLYRSQRLYEALLAAEHAVMLDDSIYTIHNLRGGLLMQHGQTKRAKASYTRSLELNPDQPTTRKILKGIEE